MKSHVVGSSEPPLLEQTIGSFLDARIRASADKLALVSRHQGIRWTWAQFGIEVDRLAAGLDSVGC